jgi:hypothetical protein
MTHCDKGGIGARIGPINAERQQIGLVRRAENLQAQA